MSLETMKERMQQQKEQLGQDLARLRSNKAALEEQLETTIIQIHSSLGAIQVLDANLKAEEQEESKIIEMPQPDEKVGKIDEEAM